MSILCCSQRNHPNDIYCKNLKKWLGLSRPKCAKDRGARSTPKGSGGGPAPASATLSRPEPTSELPTWTKTMIDGFIAMPNDPTKDQLLTLVDGLRSEGFTQDTLKMTRYIGANTPPAETGVHIRNNLIQGQAFEALNEPEAAKNFFEMASNWIRKSGDIRISARNDVPTSKMIKKLAAQRPEGLILVAQKHYTKGTYKKVLAVTQYIDGHVPLGNQPVHVQNSLIRAQALEKLNDVSAAAAFMETAADLTNMMRVQSQIDLAFERATQIR